MPRSTVSKNDILAKVYQLKTALYDGQFEHEDGEWHDGAHYTLNKVLDLLNEYAR